MSRDQAFILDEIFVTSRALVELGESYADGRLAEELRSRRKELLAKLGRSKQVR
jgi:hypothetical protein